MKIEAAQSALARRYDAVIVGAGVSGAILAKRLAERGRRVLVLEAGTGSGLNFTHYNRFLETFYQASIKIPQAPYPDNPNAPQPTELQTTITGPDAPSADGYFVQRGPQPYRSSYTRYTGGTTLHWLGTSLRMLPDDFRMRSLYDVAQDWPLQYETFSRYYEEAEREIGVSANVDEQAYHGQFFPHGYVYPMHGLPQSVVDQAMAASLKGYTYNVDADVHPLDVTSTPAARNGIPNQAYEGGKGYQPIGSVSSRAVGHRCMGNSSCVPICPIQAKYNAMKTLVASGDLVTLVTQCVATQLLIDSDTGRITGVRVQSYAKPDDPQHETYVAQGDVVALCAAPVENAKLLLASGAARNSSLVGVGLMDHPVYLTWGLLPNQVWPFRGPLATSGIEGLRWGNFRDRHASFRIEIGNDGWAWPTGAPGADVQEFIGKERLWGRGLQRALIDRVTRQVHLSFLVEQLPEAGNKVTIDDRYRDVMGNYRPVIHYDIGDYTRGGFVLAKKVVKRVFELCGIADHTTFFDHRPRFDYDEMHFNYQGAGHYMGGHRMGSSPGDSVVNADLRSWDHNNLYLVGCGSMTTSGTSNPTLTAAALSCLAADRIDTALGRHPQAITGVTA
ncbi:GMC family oxidoreductase [Burkholderia sp. Tr-862]|uniref:GMC family oxidoreductase n=1 Tax=Burkholderia sp. Tr-862 TaxID=2608331 RepID=UPI0014194C11|nr:GMC family oxidoreductase [Burkholderia sp. Tr-862]NIF41060.1 GMC family oxidoreductase [Burkholderia sp. Tr-862]